VTLDQRIGREKAFHDDLSHDEERQHTAGRFYAIDIAARNFYESQIARFDRALPILEYGCGTQLASLSSQGFLVTGIDISINSILKARSAPSPALSSVCFGVMNAERLAFGDRTFGGICGTGILHHLNLAQACAEIQRVLVPGGSAVFLEPLGHNPIINAYRRMTPRLRTADEHPLLQSDLEQLKNYFPIVDVRVFYLTALFAVPFRHLPGFHTLVRALNYADEMLFKFVPSLRQQAWIAVITLAK
jgi:SAM-dependent methyltransferase